jgi:hypothetical protein
MSESNRSDGTHTRAVGYKRPPVDRQFKPGQSGYPKGRPKGRKNLKTIFVEVLNKKVKLRDKNGTRTVSKLEAMIEVITNKALAGDPHAFARIIQIGGQLDVFTCQPEERIDLTGYNLVMRRLEEMGYGKTRPKLAAGNDAIELQQPRSSRVDADEAPLRSARK